MNKKSVSNDKARESVRKRKVITRSMDCSQSPLPTESKQRKKERINVKTIETEPNQAMKVVKLTNNNAQIVDEVDDQLGKYVFLDVEAPKADEFLAANEKLDSEEFVNSENEDE